MKTSFPRLSEDRAGLKMIVIEISPSVVNVAKVLDYFLIKTWLCTDTTFPFVERTGRTRASPRHCLNKSKLLKFSITFWLKFWLPFEIWASRRRGRRHYSVPLSHMVIAAVYFTGYTQNQDNFSLITKKSCHKLHNKYDHADKPSMPSSCLGAGLFTNNKHQFSYMIELSVNSVRRKELGSRHFKSKLVSNWTKP